MRTIAGMAITLSAGMWLATPALAGSFFFSSGTPDGRLGALSQRPSAVGIETETADDFILTQSTIITGATIVGLIPSGAPLSNIGNVEVEFYHVFPNDSVDPPSGNVPSRANSPGDVEIDDATRDGSDGTLRFAASLVNANFSVANTVVRASTRSRTTRPSARGRRAAKRSRSR